MYYEAIMYELELLLRIFVAGICGAAMGYERKSRLKEAGMRTHFIVALASALMMVVSKYSFFDVVGGDIKLDPSRIASSIISGVGFLGAGMIFVRKHTINGLTTAAGIWAISGVGMAIGAGMYFVGVAGTLIILFVQIVLHKNYWFTKNNTVENLRVLALNTPESVEEVRRIIEGRNITIINVKTETADKGAFVSVDLSVKLPKDFLPADFMTIFVGSSNIRSVDY